VRPKKRILLIDSDETRQGIRRFLLETHGFAVFSASSAEEARELCADYSPDAVVAAWPLAGADLGRLLHQLHECSPAASSLLLADSAAAVPESVMADAILPKGQCSAVQVLERVRLLSARKRGPKKTVESINHMMMLTERRIA
jgi:DNA-binding response OmpR family regulator